MNHKKLSIAVAVALASLPALFAQQPDGSDINKAIPVYFGQTTNDIGDGSTRSVVVYSITLAKGQSITPLASKTPGGNAGGDWGLFLLRPSSVTVKALQSADILGCVGINCSNGNNNAQAQTFNYQVSVAGTYYIMLQFRSSGITYSLVVTAQGTPITVPNPQTAGCLSGQVDYITYSLQLIAAGLPDEVSIGGQKACPSCTVKQPLYPEIADRLERALGNKLNVDACYDSSGNIFQIKLRQ